MHGMIFGQLRKLAERNAPGSWHGLLADAHLSGRTYLPMMSYPDEELGAIISAGAMRLGLNVDELVFELGRFLAPELLRQYRELLDSSWRTLEVIEHSESTIDRVVRRTALGATPPTLGVTRTQSDEVTVRYRSPRRLCSLARGIIVGLAEHHAEAVTIEERTCMHHGADECLVIVRRARPGEGEAP